MRVLYITILLFAFFTTNKLFGQPNNGGVSYIVLFDPKSQSNVVVNYQDLFGHGFPCPARDTNVLANTNLFTSEERNAVEKVLKELKKYKNITTNSGPAGSRLESLIQTNSYYKGSKLSSYWTARFSYPHSNNKEDVQFLNGTLRGVVFRSKGGDGYNLWIYTMGDSPVLRFMQFKGGKLNGLYLELTGPAMKTVELGGFVCTHISEYGHRTNGNAIGRFVLWNHDNNLTLDAEFKTPYDIDAHAGDFEKLWAEKRKP